MISIIIVNYNRKDLLKQCVESLRRQTFKDIEIIVVDNASKDDSVAMVKADYPEVKLILNMANLLFCKAQNQGISISKGDFVLCLNSDVTLDKDYLKEILSSAGLDSEIGMVSGKILRMDKKTIDSTGLFLGRNRKAVERGYGKIDKGQYDKPVYIFGVSGACAFLRRNMLEDIKDENGYFDERFGMYYEDLDLCWRANKKGWKAYYIPKALAYHIRGGTTVGCSVIASPPRRTKQSQYTGLLRRLTPRNDIFSRLSDDLQKRYIINRYICMMKNDTILGFLMNLPIILCYDIKLYMYFLLSKLGFLAVC